MSMAPHILRQTSFQEPFPQFGHPNTSLPVTVSVSRTSSHNFIKLDGNYIRHYTLLLFELLYLLWSSDIIVQLTLYHILYLLSNAFIGSESKKENQTKQFYQVKSGINMGLSINMKVEDKAKDRHDQDQELQWNLDEKSASALSKDDTETNLSVDARRISDQFPSDVTKITDWLTQCYITEVEEPGSVTENVNNNIPQWVLTHSVASNGLFSHVVNLGSGKDDHESADRCIKQAQMKDNSSENSCTTESVLDTDMSQQGSDIIKMKVPKFIEKCLLRKSCPTRYIKTHFYKRVNGEDCKENDGDSGKDESKSGGCNYNGKDGNKKSGTTPNCGMDGGLNSPGGSSSGGDDGDDDNFKNNKTKLTEDNIEEEDEEQIKEEDEKDLNDTDDSLTLSQNEEPTYCQSGKSDDSSIADRTILLKKNLSREDSGIADVEIPEQIILYPFDEQHLGVIENCYRENLEYFKKDYIGGGRFGKCYTILDATKKELLVVKQVPQDQFNENELITMRILDRQCPGLMPCYGAILEENTIKIYMPYAAVGSVYDFLEDAKHETGDAGLNESHCLYIFHGLLSAVRYMHDRRIMHRDIKTANLLINLDAPYVMLADFGLAKILDKDLEYLQDDTPEGTYFYLSPEVIMSKPYSLKADIWSCICVLYELQTGDPPWINYAVGVLPYIIGRRSPPQIPKDCQYPVRELYEIGWKVDETERATAAELLQADALRQVVPIHPMNSSGFTDLC